MEKKMTLAEVRKGHERVRTILNARIKESKLLAKYHRLTGNKTKEAEYRRYIGVLKDSKKW